MTFILKKVYYKRWLPGCLLFFIIACHSKNNYNLYNFSKADSIKEAINDEAAIDSIYNIKRLIKQGDLIVRSGRDFTSETFRRLSKKDKTYSHCGIAGIEHDLIFVYHSIGGEWNPDQATQRCS